MDTWKLVMAVLAARGEQGDECVLKQRIWLHDVFPQVTAPIGLEPRAYFKDSFQRLR